MEKQQMDPQYKRTMKVLKEIEVKLPSNLPVSLMKTIINTDQEEAAKEMLKTDLTPEVRKILEEDLKNGAFRFEEEIVDEDIAKQIDDYFDKEVKAAIADGRLPHPDDDPYFNKRMDAIEAKKKKS